jgi:hypothetical protein
MVKTLTYYIYIYIGYSETALAARWPNVVETCRRIVQKEKRVSKFSFKTEYFSVYERKICRVIKEIKVTKYAHSVTTLTNIKLIKTTPSNLSYEITS